MRMRRPRSWPWWLQVVAVVLLARAFSAVVFAAVATTQAAAGWVEASPSYFPYTGLMWDASWYREIAEQGYPAGLPRGADGAVQQNAWAFFPLFPLLVRGTMVLTRAPWDVVAPLLATALGVAAMLVVHRVVTYAMAQPRAAALDRVRPGAREVVPIIAVALLATSASAPILQTGYTESLALLLVVVVLWAVQREKYVMAALAVVALGFTRAVALPVVVVVVAHGIVRWRTLSNPRRAGALVLGAVAGISGLAWPTIVGWSTGVPGAYALTQGAWRGRQAVIPLVPWLDVARWLFGGWGNALLVVLAVVLAAVMGSRAMRRLGPELVAWAAGYVGYLVAVIEPGTSLLRFAILGVPFWAALAQPVATSRRRSAVLAALVVVGLLGQIAWVGLIWRLVPPSGWPP